MTRDELSNHVNKRVRIIATVADHKKRYKAKNGRIIPTQTFTTYVLEDIEVDVKPPIVIDHTWLMAGRWSRSVQIGDRIELSVSVCRYKKRIDRKDFGGMAVWGMDWGFKKPKFIRKVSGDDR